MHSKKRTLKTAIVVILIITLLLVGLFYFYYQNSKAGNTKNDSATEPLQTTNKSITSVNFNNCQVDITFSDQTIANVGTLGSDGFETNCIKTPMYRISDSGKYLVFEDISGGVDTWIRIYSTNTNSFNTLSVLGSSSLLDFEFAKGDVLAVLSGYTDIPEEQWLTVYNTNELYSNYPNNVNEFGYFVGENVQTVLDIEPVAGNYFNVYLDDTYLYVQGGKQSNPVQRLKYPLSQLVD